MVKTTMYVSFLHFLLDWATDDSDMCDVTVVQNSNPPAYSVGNQGVELDLDDDPNARSISVGHGHVADDSIPSILGSDALFANVSAMVVDRMLYWMRR